MLKVKRVAAITVASVVALSSYAYADEGLKDIPNDWSNTAITAAVQNGLIYGDNGYVKPQDKLTRSQMAAMISRAFGSTVKGDISKFRDVKSDAWYCDDMAKAVSMGAFEGADGKLMPEKNITRQEAMAVLSRVLLLDGNDASGLDSFKDADKVADWAKGSVAAMVKAGYVNGNDGYINPDGEITRAEFAQLMYKVASVYIDNTKTLPTEVKGNLMINTPEYTLNGGVIDGDVIIGDGVGDGTIYIKGTKVGGRLVVRGGGEHSIKIVDTSISGQILSGRPDGPSHIDMDSKSTAGGVAVLTGNTTLDGNFNTVAVSAAASANINSGTVGELVVNGAGASAQIGSGAKVTSAVVSSSAASSTITVNGIVGSMNIQAPSVGVSGKGSVTNATIAGNDAKFGLTGTSITVSESVTGTTVNGNKVDGGTKGTTAATGVGTTTATTPAKTSGGGSGGSGGSSTVYYGVEVKVNGTVYDVKFNVAKTDKVKAVALRAITSADGFAVAANKTTTQENLAKLKDILSGSVEGNEDIKSWESAMKSATSSVSNLTGSSLIDGMIHDINNDMSIENFASKYGTITVEFEGRSMTISAAKI